MASDLLLMLVVLALHSSEHFVSSGITDVRLVGGPTTDRGTIELMQDNGTWETTCGENIGIDDVIVICKHLGFKGANIFLTATPYKQDSTPRSGLQCNGDEADLSECTLFQSQSCLTAGAATCNGDRYLGCFQDSTTDRVLSGNNLVADPDITISYCIQYCNDSVTAEYIYAGVGFGNECFCGMASDVYARLGEGTDSDCQFPCSGDSNESCGGSGYIAVFRIPDLPSTPTAVPTLASTQQSTVHPTSVPKLPSTPTTVPTLASTQQSIILHTPVNTPSPTTRGVSSTGSVETTPTGKETSETPQSPVMTTMSKPQTVPPPNGDNNNNNNNNNNIGLYAGAAGGVVAIFIVVIIIIIVVVVLMKKRSRGKQKDQLRSHDMTVMQPASPNGGQNNLYHDIFQDMKDASTPDDSQLPVPSAEGDSMYYSSVKDQTSAEGDDTYYSSVKDQKTADEDSKPNNATSSWSSNQYDGLPETGVVRLPPHGDAATMYAMPDKQGRKSQGEDFGALYAKSDKTGDTGDGQASEDFGILYAMPDKTRGMPEGREDVKVSDLCAMPDKSQGQDQGRLDSELNDEEGLYPLADDDTGLYAMSTAPGHTVNFDDEYGTIMVDNELYAM